MKRKQIPWVVSNQCCASIENMSDFGQQPPTSMRTDMPLKFTKPSFPTTSGLRTGDVYVVQGTLIVS